jgi:hypothetical protein
VTPPLGTRGPALAASTIPPLSVRPCGTLFSNTQEGQNRCWYANHRPALSRVRDPKERESEKREREREGINGGVWRTLKLLVSSKFVLKFIIFFILPNLKVLVKKRRTTVVTQLVLEDTGNCLILPPPPADSVTEG